MKRVLMGTLLVAVGMVVPLPARAVVDISIGISLPPPIVFQAPPEVIVMPETNGVYVVPDIEGDLFFWNGWWWRLWEGRWYRSRYYDQGWGYYARVPRFYFDVDPGWRAYYRAHAWYGHRWDAQRIPPPQLQQHWQSWQNDRHWERQGTWGVQNFHPRPQAQSQALRQQRQQQYHQRPEVQQHQREGHQQQRQPPERVQGPQGPPQVQQARPHPQERGQPPQRHAQRPQAQQPEHSQPQGRPEGG